MTQFSLLFIITIPSTQVQAMKLSKTGNAAVGLLTFNTDTYDNHKLLFGVDTVELFVFTVWYIR